MKSVSSPITQTVTSSNNTRSGKRNRARGIGIGIRRLVEHVQGTLSELRTERPPPKGTARVGTTEIRAVHIYFAVPETGARKGAATSATPTGSVGEVTRPGPATGMVGNGIDGGPEVLAPLSE